MSSHESPYSNVLGLKMPEGGSCVNEPMLIQTGTNNTCEIQNSPNPNQRSNNMVTVGPGTSSQIPVLTTRGSGTSSWTQSQNDSYTQVSVNKLLEILLQTLHSKQSENNQLKEDYALLEQNKICVTCEKNPLPVSKKPSTGNKTKEPVSRTKSAPESSVYPQGHSDFGKTSRPQIFLFPETKDKRNNTLPPNSNANEINIMKDQATSMSVDDDAYDVKTGDSGVHSDNGSGEYHSLKDSLQEPPGVSKLYFNNVINELIKTKACLHNLLKQQVCIIH